MKSTTAILKRVNATTPISSMQTVAMEFQKTRMDSSQKRDLISDVVEDDAEEMLGEDQTADEKLDEMMDAALEAELPSASAHMGEAQSSRPSRAVRPGERLPGWN